MSEKESQENMIKQKREEVGQNYGFYDEASGIFYRIGVQSAEEFYFLLRQIRAMSPQSAIIQKLN